MNSKEMVKIAYEALSDKKGQDIKIIDIQSVSVLADYFIIADGSNPNQVQAMADNVEEMLGKAGCECKQIEAIRVQTGFLWTTKILSCIFSAAKTVCSMIWSVSGEMERHLWM